MFDKKNTHQHQPFTRALPTWCAQSTEMHRTKTAECHSRIFQRISERLYVHNWGCHLKPSKFLSPVWWHLHESETIFGRRAEGNFPSMISIYRQLSFWYPQVFPSLKWFFIDYYIRGNCPHMCAVFVLPLTYTHIIISVLYKVCPSQSGKIPAFGNRFCIRGLWFTIVSTFQIQPRCLSTHQLKELWFWFTLWTNLWLVEWAVYIM